MESPGFSAKYYTVTLIEYDSSDMFVMVFIEKTSTNYNSTDMDSAGFEKALEGFSDW